MSEMIERIARALQREDFFGDIEAADAAWGDTSRGDAYQRSYRTNARVAIEAMREPTKEMLSAGAFYHIKHAGAAGNVELGLARDAYKAMIAAALKD